MLVSLTIYSILLTFDIILFRNININIRMYKELKKQFEEFCDDMGMSMTIAINLFVKKTVKEYRIPFEIGGKKPNRETIEAMNEIKQMEKDPSIGKSYSNVNQLMDDLLK